MVQDGAVGEPALRGATDLALVGGDVVERHVTGVDTHLAERTEHPVVQERVRLFEAQTLNQRSGHHQRVGDAVARLHEHRSATRDAAYHLDAMSVGARLVDLVAVGLE